LSIWLTKPLRKTHKALASNDEHLGGFLPELGNDPYSDFLSWVGYLDRVGDMAVKPVKSFVINLNLQGLFGFSFGTIPSEVF
jgi:hypothetical protein